MRGLAEAVVGASIVAVIYAIVQAIIAANTTDRVDWLDVNGKALVTFVVSGVIIGILRGWKTHQEGRPISGNNVGIILAIVAGLLLLGYAIWAAPFLQSGGTSGTGIIGIVVGLGFLASVFLVDRSATLSKAILGIGALVLLASALLAGQLFGGDKGWVLTGVSLLPMILAALAALLIGPPQREMVP